MMRPLLTSIAIVLAVSACQPGRTGVEPGVPTNDRQGRQAVAASFEYVVTRDGIAGAYDPTIFDRDRVAGHARRACVQFEITDYAETRRGDRVGFSLRCRKGVIPAEQGRWVVERGTGGEEKARKI